MVALIVLVSLYMRSPPYVAWWAKSATEETRSPRTIVTLLFLQVRLWHRHWGLEAEATSHALATRGQNCKALYYYIHAPQP